MPSPIRHASPLFAYCLLLLSMSGGCYSGEEMVENVRDQVLRDRLEEVDLGTYRLTMPKNPKTTEITEVQMHVFGSTARYLRKDVMQQIEQRQFELRHKTLLTVREAKPEDFVDPDLIKLRQRLITVANEVLAESPIKQVGFYEIRFVKN